MSIVALYTASSPAAQQTASTAVAVKVGMGIVGDRYFARRKSQLAKNLSLIEWESIALFQHTFAQSLRLDSTRRNVVTRGVHLNALVGQTFMLGEVRLRGIELCEPCGKLTRLLAAETGLPVAELMQFWTRRGGLRCEVLSSGVLRLGDGLVVA
jgi:MOSC domain-containing protein YiiM